jgi:hypothetical protein
MNVPMSRLHTIVREVAQIVMGIGVVGFWAWSVYRRQRRIVEDRDHKAGIQTLFSGRK